MTTALHHIEPIPQTIRERDLVLNELRLILASPQFCNSKRYPAFLQYVVESTLAGKTESLKERTIGIDVFHRPPTYDTNADTVVRFTAGEVRKRLAAYYHEFGQDSKVRITLPPGSYAPEFLYEPNERTHGVAFAAPPTSEETSALGVTGHSNQLDSLKQGVSVLPPVNAELPALASAKLPRSGSRRVLSIGAVIVLILVGLLAVQSWRTHHLSPIEAFWQPVLRDRSTILLCAGGNVFSPNPIPGFITAGKETDYPYFSLQTATSITLLSTLVQRNGGTPQFEFAASTPLPDLHSHPIILLNAYNNQWTLRLVGPLRFYFTAGSGTDQSIADRERPGTTWKRDPSVPYSSADDYALMARFWDTTTENWVIVLAGLGRNGTEAASEFVTSSEDLQALRTQAGGNFANENIEAILKTNVIDGKTGPPSIVAVHVW